MQNFEEIRPKIEDYCKEHARLCELLTYEEVLIDKKLFLNLDKKSRLLEPLVTKYNDLLQVEADIKTLKELIFVETSESKIIEQERLVEENKKNHMCEEIIRLYAQINANFEVVFVEIVCLKEELSSQLGNDLKNSYEQFCLKNNLSFNVDTENNIIRIEVSGLNANGYFWQESGLHFAKKEWMKGKCQVYVFKDLNEIKLSFEDNEIKIEYFRSSGAGGQHINKTDSAVKVTHEKTGITAICQDERSQHKNKEKAIARLKEKIENFTKEQTKTLINNQRKEQLSLMKNKQYVRFYDYDLGKVILADDKEYLLDEFLQGKLF